MSLVKIDYGKAITWYDTSYISRLSNYVCMLRESMTYLNGVEMNHNDSARIDLDYLKREASTEYEKMNGHYMDLYGSVRIFGQYESVFRELMAMLEPLYNENNQGYKSQMSNINLNIESEIKGLLSQNDRVGNTEYVNSAISKSDKLKWSLESLLKEESVERKDNDLNNPTMTKYFTENITMNLAGDTIDHGISSYYNVGTGLVGGSKGIVGVGILLDLGKSGIENYHEYTLTGDHVESIFDFTGDATVIAASAAVGAQVGAYIGGPAVGIPTLGAGTGIGAAGGALIGALVGAGISAFCLSTDIDENISNSLTGAWCVVKSWWI